MDTYLKIIAEMLLVSGLNLPTQQPDAAAVALSDDVITSRIELELRTNVQLREAVIEVSTSAGVVTLEGAVDNLVEKQRAEQLCRQANGVTAVDNRLNVQVSPDALWNIAATIEQRFSEDTLLHENKLTVKSQQGIVILGGEVENWYQMSHAERIARQVPGVLFVRNEIRVQPQTDESLRTVVLDLLERDERFNALLLDVEVEKQIVTLNGYVESPLQRDLAESRAESVPGVLGVDNRLVVAYSPRHSFYR